MGEDISTGTTKKGRPSKNEKRKPPSQNSEDYEREGLVKKQTGGGRGAKQDPCPYSGRGGSMKTTN